MKETQNTMLFQMFISTTGEHRQSLTRNSRSISAVHDCSMTNPVGKRRSLQETGWQTFGGFHGYQVILYCGARLSVSITKRVISIKVLVQEEALSDQQAAV